MTWVTTITRNLLVDHFRKTKQDRVTDSLDSAPSEHEDAMPLSEQIVDKKAPPPGLRLPLTADAGIESIPVRVNGTAVQAEFDLGNGTDVLISRAVVNRLGLRIIGRKAGGGIGGGVVRDLVRIKSLDLGGLHLRNVVAAIDDQSNAGELNVGTSVLKHFLITVDFAGHSVWLKPKRN